MKPLLLLFVVVLICFFAFTSFGQQATQPSHRFFEVVQMGQSVSLKEDGPFYEISILGNGSIGLYKVIAIQSEYIDLVDQSGMREVRVPLHAIRSITHIKVGAPK